MPIVMSYSIRSETLTQRGHAKLMRELNREMITRVRDVYWPRHFEVNANTRPGGGYGYEARKKGYQIAKAKAKGHQKPLVWSGKMKGYVQQAAKITATQHRGRLIARNYMPMSAHRRRELETVAISEKAEIARLVPIRYAELAKKPEYMSRKVRDERGRFTSSR